MQQPRCPARHLGRRTARKSQQQQALRVGSLLHQPGQTRSQRQRLAGARTGDDQQWAGGRRVGRGLRLFGVEFDDQGHGRAAVPKKPRLYAHTETRSGTRGAIKTGT